MGHVHWAVSVLAVLLLSMVHSCYGLTQVEKDVLLDLRTAIPAVAYRWDPAYVASACWYYLEVQCSNAMISGIALDYVNLAYRGAPQGGTIPQSIGNLSNTTFRALSLKNFKIEGSLPSALRNLSALESLDLTNNALEGAIPDWISEFVNLKTLDLSHNRLSGPITESIFSLTNLQKLNLAFNTNSTGTISPSIGNLVNLNGLTLAGMNLNGTIPDVFGSMASLTEIDLRSNRLSGPFPTSLTQLKMLNRIDFSSNQISGPVDYILEPLLNSAATSSLTYLDLSNNILEGTLPASFQNTSLLTDLKLSANKITGPIPDFALANLTKLNTLYLDRNNLTGSFPAELPPKMWYLNIGENHLSGPLPPETLARGAHALVEFNASHNFFSGELPSTLYKNINMKYLDLSNNLFEGEISPAAIQNLTKLSELDLSHNSFTGNLPLIQFPYVESIDVSSNKFSGALLVDWAAVPYLRFFNASHNAFSGSISPSIQNTTWRFLQLDLSHNSLTGSIPPELATLSNLIYLNLSNNQLTGTLPDMSQMDLVRLDLSNNSLSGKIVWGVLPLSVLEEFIIFNNNFTGELPSGVTYMSSLTSLQTFGNSFSGCTYVMNANNTEFACNASSLMPLCTCFQPSVCAIPLCPSCVDDSCTGAKVLDGAICNASADCMSNTCVDGFCAQAVVQTPVGVGSSAGAVAAAIVVSIVVIAAISIAVGLFLWRRKDKPRFDIWAANAEPLTELDRLKRQQQQQEIKPEELHFMHELGKGSAGSVHLATYKGEFVAVKSVARGGDGSLHLEAEAMAAIRAHRNVVKLIGTCKDNQGGRNMIVMEFCPRGSLNNYVKQRIGKALDEYEVFRFAYGIANGMIALADAGVVHRDLAGRNILLSEKLFAKVSDFGSQTAQTAGDSLGPVKWQAPELLREQTLGAYSEKSDAWAYGCTMIELLTGREPYADYKGSLLQLVADIRDSGLNPLSHLEMTRTANSQHPVVNIPEWIYGVLKSCFNANPAERPTFREVRFHLGRSAKSFQNAYENEEDEADSLLSSPVAATYSSVAGPQSNPERLWTSRSPKSSNTNKTQVLFQNSSSQSQSRVDLENIERLGKLGAGSFGAVYLGITQGAYVALKVLTVSGSEADALREAELMMNIQAHRNIVQLHGMISQQNQLTIVMEFAPRGSLESLIAAQKQQQQTSVISEGLLFKWAIGIARGMEALASSKIIHRDLAVRNILLDSALEPKIADFGLARTVLDPNQESSTKTDMGPIRWFAPECYQLKYSEKTDVWAYGCTLVEIVTANVPFAHLKLFDVITAVRDQGRTPLEAFDPQTTPTAAAAAVPSWLMETMRKCFSRGPNERASFTELVVHLERVGPTIQEIRDAEAEIQKRRERRADIRSMQIR